MVKTGAINSSPHLTVVYAPRINGWLWWDCLPKIFCIGSDGPILALQDVIGCLLTLLVILYIYTHIHIQLINYKYNCFSLIIDQFTIIATLKTPDKKIIYGGEGNNNISYHYIS